MRASSIPTEASIAAPFVVALVSIPGFAGTKAFAVVAYFLWRLWTKGVSFRGLSLAVSVLGGLLLWYAVGQARQVPLNDGQDQLSRLLIFFCVLASAYYLRAAFRSPEALDRVTRNAALVSAVSKILITIAVLFFKIPFEDIQQSLGFESVTQPLGFDLQRLQFPSDFVILFLLSCYFGGKSRVADIVFIASIAVVVMLSFSRFIFICFFVAILVRMIWTRKMDLIPKSAVALVVVLSLAFSDVLAERFVGDAAEQSDDIRVLQVEYLSELIALRPLGGSGIGASVPSYVRSDSQPYSYEMQWYATIMQFGWVGLCWLLGTFVAILAGCVRNQRALICLSLLVLMWILSGFTNPFLVSLGTAVGFSIAIWRCGIADPRTQRKAAKTRLSRVVNTPPCVGTSPPPSALRS